MRRVLTVTAAVFAVAALAQPRAAAVQVTATETPTIDQLISLKRAGSAAISPNGQWVAYTVRDTNWDENAYHTEIWLADAKSGELRQLTSHAKKSSTSPTWSPDSTKLAFATDRDDKRQIYVIDPRGGEARKLTSVEEGVGGFAWAPDGKSIAFTSDRAEDRRRQGSRKEVRRLRRHRRGLPDVAPLGLRHRDARRRGGSRAARSPSASSAGRPTARRSPSITASTPPNTSGATADISVVTVADGKVRPLVTQAGADTGPVWSPDGSKIAFGSAMTQAVLVPQQRASPSSRRPAAASRTSPPPSTRIRRSSDWTPRRALLQRVAAAPGRFSTASIRRPGGEEVHARRSSGSARASA